MQFGMSSYLRYPGLLLCCHSMFYARVSVHYFSLIQRDSLTRCIGSTVLLPVTVVLSIGMVAWLPCTSDFLRWPSDAVSLIFFNEPREFFDLIHPQPQRNYCSYIWLLSVLLCMEDITFILRVGVVCISMQLMPH